uniref:ORF3 protein n=1 Tax=Middle East respiratory syndrome-related coronavirus TaxID=1335626 RepID=A0A2R2YRH8_MERS|nr:ORF3 protein [Middle East respiratory syndrome-related coronavirus]
MRVQRPLTLLLVVTLSLLANAFSKPFYIPEHCQNYSGRMLRACIRTAQTDTVGLYTNLRIDLPSTDSTGTESVTVDRGSFSTHDDISESVTSVNLFDVGYTVN